MGRYTQVGICGRDITFPIDEIFYNSSSLLDRSVTQRKLESNGQNLCSRSGSDQRPHPTSSRYLSSCVWLRPDHESYLEKRFFTRRRRPGSGVASAPNCSANVRRKRLRSTACTLAPAALANKITPSPMGPAPITRACSPLSVRFSRLHVPQFQAFQSSPIDQGRE